VSTVQARTQHRHAGWRGMWAQYKHAHNTDTQGDWACEHSTSTHTTQTCRVTGHVSTVQARTQHRHAGPHQRNCGTSFRYDSGGVQAAHRDLPGDKQDPLSSARQRLGAEVATMTASYSMHAHGCLQAVLFHYRISWLKSHAR